MTPVPSSRRVRRRRVADEDRKRAPRACTRCKARKSKCIETASGICQRCRQGSYTCTFESQQSPTSPDVSSATVRAQALPQDSDQTPSSAALADDPHARPVARRHHCSDDNAPENFMWPKFLSRLRNAFYLEPQPTAAEKEMSLEAHSSPTSPTRQSAEAARLQAAIDSLPPQPVAEFLIRLCVKHGTDSFFYFEQDMYELSVENFYKNPNSHLRRHPSFVCLLLAVLALGSQWTPRARPEAIDGPPISSEGDPGRIFCSHARVLMADTMDRVSIFSVQAAFVLGVYLMPSSAIGASYLYMGLALRKALAMRLNEEPDDPELEDYEKEIRCRLWWAIYSLERTLTIKLNRPRSVGQEIIKVRLPERQMRDEWHAFDNFDHQIANAQLVKIIDPLIEPAAWSSNLHPALEEYEPLLKSWKRSLPENLRLKNLEHRSQFYRAVLHLHLNYYFAWIAIGKTSVVTTIRSRIRSAMSGVTEDGTANSDEYKQFRSCSRAAKKMLELLEGASDSGNLAPTSFTDFQSCSIATIILILTGILERDPTYEAQVGFGLSCLRKMANVHAAGQTAVRFVKVLVTIAEEAREKLESQPTRLNARTDEEVADYRRWADWFASVTEQSEDGTTRRSASRHPSPGSSRTARTEANALPMWEEAAALLQLRNPATPSGPSVANQAEHAFDADMEDDLPSTNFVENHLQLMGLTGMDMLDFEFDFE